MIGKLMDSVPLHFIVSAPRSGSTWLANALNQHPEVFATEQRLFGEFCEIWRNNDGSSAPRITADSFAKAFAVHYFHDELGLNHGQFVSEFQDAFIKHMVGFAQHRSGKHVVIDKITPYPGTALKVVEQIKKRLPNAKVVQLVRDGRDVLTSGTFDWLLKDAVGSPRHEFFINRDQSQTLGRFFDDDVVRKWALNWRETIEVFDTYPAHEVVKYEAMLTNQAKELEKIFASVGVIHDPKLATECAEAVTFRKMTGRNAGDAEPIAKARIGIAGDWKKYFTRADGELFSRLAGEHLIQMGYETDNSWTATLPEKLSLNHTTN